MCVWVHMYVQTRDPSQVLIFRSYPPFFFWDVIIYWPSSPGRLGWPASKPQLTFCLHLPSAEHATMPDFLTWALGIKLRPWCLYRDHSTTLGYGELLPHNSESHPLPNSNQFDLVQHHPMILSALMEIPHALIVQYDSHQLQDATKHSECG